MQRTARGTNPGRAKSESGLNIQFMPVRIRRVTQKAVQDTYFKGKVLREGRIRQALEHKLERQDHQARLYPGDPCTHEIH